MQEHLQNKDAKDKVKTLVLSINTVSLFCFSLFNFKLSFKLYRQIMKMACISEEFKKKVQSILFKTSIT